MTDFPEKTALELIRSNKIQMVRLMRALKRANATIDIRTVPLAFPAENPEEITVFPNIIIDVKKPLDVEECLSPTGLRSRNKRALASLKHTYETEIADEHRARRWEKADSVLAKKEKTTVARFLRNHLKLHEKGMKDDQIRDIATKVELFFKPPGLKICDSPADYVQQFSVNTGSCMTKNSSYFDEPTKKLIKDGRYPSEWYHFNPHIKGVYLEKEGNCLARGFLLRTDPTKPFQHFSNVMGATGEHITKLTQLLEQAGYKNGLHKIDITTHFEVPVIEMAGKKYSPLPFHDCISWHYYIAWDASKNVFRYGPLKEFPKDLPYIKERSPYDFKGFIRPHDIK